MRQTLNDMDFQKKYRQIRNLAIVFGMITLGLYAINFFGAKISSDPGDWGVFGDYVGGLLNPVISFLNLLLTYYIAQMVNEFSKRENLKQVIVQNKIIKSQLRYDAFKDFQKDINFQFEKIHDPTVNSSMVKYSIQQAIKIVVGFHQTYNHLFTKNPMFHTRLVNDLQSAIQTIDQTETLRQNFSRQHTGQSTSDILEPLTNSKDSMLSNLNREIVEILDNNLIVE